MTVRAMFYVASIKHHATSRPEEVTAEIELAAAFGGYLKGLPGGDDVNKDWSKYTPAGNLKMTVTNPGAIEQFQLGEVYSLTFEKVSA